MLVVATVAIASAFGLVDPLIHIPAEARIA